MNNVATIYWIHHPDHTDIATQGYIGFTQKTLEHRYKKHIERSKNVKRSGRLGAAIRKYGHDKLILKPLFIGHAEYCLEMENKLRPKCSIGWNTGPGGSKTTLGRKATPEQRAHFSKVHSGRPHSEEWRRMMSEKFKGRKFRLGTKIIGRKHEKVTCPHCGKIGGGSVMQQWHFDKCRG
jgi:hypothetical protein